MAHLCACAVGVIGNRVGGAHRGVSVYSTRESRQIANIQNDNSWLHSILVFVVASVFSIRTLALKTTVCHIRHRFDKLNR